MTDPVPMPDDALLARLRKAHSQLRANSVTPNSAVRSVYVDAADRIATLGRELEQARAENAALLQAMQDEGMDISDATIDAAIRASAKESK